MVLAVYYGVLTDWNFHAEGRFPWLFVGSYVDLRVTLPFVPSRIFEPNLGWLYLPFMVFMVVATSNAVNLTDGLDGLAIGPTIVSAVTFLALSYVAGATIAGFSLAEYLRIAYIPGAEELGVFCAAIVGRRGGVPLVQHLPGLGVHGRRRLAGAGRRAGRCWRSSPRTSSRAPSSTACSSPRR